MKHAFVLLALSSMLLSPASSQDNPLSELFGKALTNASGEAVSVESLKGKLVGVYFSAGWCPPCRAFTPELVKFHARKDKEFEVVFVSGDKSEQEKQQYIKDYQMNWLTVPLGSQQAAHLAQLYAVSSIPTLVVLDDQGKVISATATQEMAEGPEKAFLGWKKAAGMEILPADLQGNPLSDLFGYTLTNASGEEVSVDSLKGKLVGVYFSAGWCPPCRAFTPELVRFHARTSNEFEVVFVSGDKSEQEKQQYIKNYQMNWLTVPLGSQQAAHLAKLYDVSSIPTLVILDDRGNVISATATQEMAGGPDKAFLGWKNAAGKDR